MERETGTSSTRSLPRFGAVLTAAVFLGAAVFMAWFSLPLFLGQVYTEDDCGAFHLPLRAFYHACLQAGDSFLWMPGILNGFYLHGEGQAAMLHPVNYALYRWLPLSTAFMLEILYSYPLMFLGLYWFLRRWNLPRHACGFGGLLFTFIGASMNHYVHVHCVSAFAHLPINLLAIDWAMRPRSKREWLAGLAVLWASSSFQLLQGAPQYTYFTWLPEMAYALLLTRDFPAFRTLLLLGVFKALAMFSCTAQLWPMWETLNNSYRAAPDAQFRLSISLHPLNLMQMISPYLFQRRVFAPFKGDEPWDAPYLGAAAIPLLLYLLIRWRGMKTGKPVAWLSFGLMGFGLLAAMGHYGHFHYLLDWIPVLNKLRAPARYVAVAHAGMALGAALGLAELSRREPGGVLKRWQTLLLLTIPAAGITFTVTLYLLKAQGNEAFTALLGRQLMPWPLAMFGVALVTAGTLCVILAAQGWRAALLALVLLTLGDIGLYSLRHKPYQRFEEYLAEIHLPPTPPGARIDSDIHPMYMNRFSIAGYRGVFGYVSLYPARKLDYTQIPALQLAGVTWRETRYGMSPELNAAKEHGESWIPLEGALPRARLMTRAEVCAEPGAALASTDLRHTALTYAPVELDAGEPGRAEIVTDRPGHLVIHLSAPARQLLVVAENYHLGWKAQVNGESRPVMPVYGDFMGCVVGPGDETVELTFTPEGYAEGKWLSLAGIVATGLLLTFLGMRNGERGIG